MSYNILNSAHSKHQKEQKSGNGLWSVRMADSCITREPNLAKIWSYEIGVVLKGIERVWLDTGNKKYFDYIKRNLEPLVKPDGDIHTYNLQDFNLEHINTGKLFFQLYKETTDERYRLALQLLIRQLKAQPRTSEGGFWHKKINSYQMWLDGIYMSAPFYAQYADQFDEPGGFDEVAHQILLIERHTHDPRTGLYYYAWDESKMQKWANPQTGCSPHFWGSAMGWYTMAILDVLDFLPKSHPAWNRIVTIFEKIILVLVTVQDTDTGLWYQILDKGGYEGNYTEASVSSMFVYSLAKGIRKGYLSPKYVNAAQKGYAGIIEHLIDVNEYGQVNLMRTSSASGLYGENQPDGYYKNYIDGPIITNDHKGVGVFLHASSEIESLNKNQYEPE